MRDHLRRNRAVWVVIAALVAVAVAVQAPDAVNESFWADEVASGHVITAPTPAPPFSGSAESHRRRSGSSSRERPTGPATSSPL